VACNTFASGCATDISIGLQDVEAIYNKYQTQFKDLWNRVLASANIVISNVVQVATSTQITYTVTLNWDSVNTNITQVLLVVKNQFAATLGVTASQVTTFTVGTNKRAGMATDDVKVVVTGQSSGANSLTFFMAPVIILNALLWLFK
jgi:hypothetical protein